MPKSLAALLVVAVIPLVALDLAAGDSVAAVATALVGLLVLTMLLALVRESRHDVGHGDGSGSTLRRT